MARQPRQLAQSGIYHVMLRGINRDVIFLEDADFATFLRAVDETRAAAGCSLFAYCLMPNHAHLVLRTGDETLGQVLKRLNVRYAGRFNRKYGRVGHLFQDRYRSFPIDDDAYFLAVLPYVWNNPVVAGLAQRPEDYRWSSRRFLGGGSPLVDEDELTGLLGSDALQLAVAQAAIGVALDPSKPGKYNVDSAGDLLERLTGVRNPAEFNELGATAQLGVVGALRTHGVPYSLIGRLIGRPKSTVVRMQAAGKK